MSWFYFCCKPVYVVPIKRFPIQRFILSTITPYKSHGSLKSRDGPAGTWGSSGKWRYSFMRIYAYVDIYIHIHSNRLSPREFLKNNRRN
ncbi:hypothetical protein QTP88_009189 [Uroleucon formosanum]